MLSNEKDRCQSSTNDASKCHDGYVVMFLGKLLGNFPSWVALLVMKMYFASSIGNSEAGLNVIFLSLSVLHPLHCRLIGKLFCCGLKKTELTLD